MIQFDGVSNSENKMRSDDLGSATEAGNSNDTYSGPVAVSLVVMNCRNWRFLKPGFLKVTKYTKGLHQASQYIINANGRFNC